MIQDSHILRLIDSQSDYQNKEDVLVSILMSPIDLFGLPTQANQMYVTA